MTIFLQVILNGFRSCLFVMFFLYTNFIYIWFGTINTSWTMRSSQSYDSPKLNKQKVYYLQKKITHANWWPWQSLRHSYNITVMTCFRFLGWMMMICCFLIRFFSALIPVLSKVESELGLLFSVNIKISCIFSNY